MVKTQWELCACKADKLDLLEKYFYDNWEPFAVTATRVNMSSGASCPSEVIWLRRITKKEVTEN